MRFLHAINYLNSHFKSDINVLDIYFKSADFFFTQCHSENHVYAMYVALSLGVNTYIYNNNTLYCRLGIYEYLKCEIHNRFYDHFAVNVYHCFY